MERHREEVINVFLAESLRDLGMEASGEQIEVIGGKRALPDVLFDYKGLRCMIEGKYADVPDAQDSVMKQAIERVETGIAHMALAVVYPVDLRETKQEDLAERLYASRFAFSLCTMTRYIGVEWHEGGVRDLLDHFRRGYTDLLQDDVVARAVAELKAGMESLVRVFHGNPDVVEKIADYIGITDKETVEKAEDADGE